MSLAEGMCIREIQGLEMIILSGVNQTEKDNYHVICLYVESKKKKNGTNDPIYKTERDQTCGHQRQHIKQTMVTRGKRERDKLGI